jgi:hypothetical protein
MESTYLAVIKVVGAGGGGTNAVSRMVDAGLKGVEFIAVNTDVQALQACEADIKLAVGHQLTHGLGAGANPDVGAGAAPWSLAIAEREPDGEAERRVEALRPGDSRSDTGAALFCGYKRFEGIYVERDPYAGICDIQLDSVSRRARFDG